MAEKAVIEIRDLVKNFGAFTAVNHLSFNVNSGEVFGFLGANGAGKTTTIRMICGLVKPSSGDILVNGHSVNHDTEMVKRSLGYMSQKFSLYMDLTPAQNIDFFGSIYGVSTERKKEETDRFAELAGTRALNQLTGSLPMGFKQRLGLICALIHDPPLLFLDEPTSGVDPAGRREFWEEIYRLSSQGKTIVVTTHFMDEAEYCGRVAIMNTGRLIDLDSPDQIRKKYQAEDLNSAFIAAVERDRSKE